LGDASDLTGVTNSTVEVISGEPDFEHVPVNVKPNMAIIGPKFRKQAGAIIKTLTSMDPVEVAEIISKGNININIDGEDIELEPESVTIEKEVISEGRAVDVLDVNGTVVVIVR
ncbi:MAG: DUF5915 domain-containing protein, partial [Methanococcoides sp.]|nr:DUF5915 domain-containing protein [Methanococcoides sp.]